MNGKKPLSFLDPSTTTTTTTPPPILSEVDALCREGAPDYNLPPSTSAPIPGEQVPSEVPSPPAAESTTTATPAFLLPPSADQPYPAVLPDGPPPSANDVPAGPVINDSR